MEKKMNLIKRILLMIISISIIVGSTSACITTSAAEGYSVTVTDNGIICDFNDVPQTDVYLFVAYINDAYCVVESNEEDCVLYYFDKNGAGTVFTGVYSGKYYEAGKLAAASSSYYKVYKDKLYKVEANGSASIYKKDASKSGTYVKLVDNICYNVNYKTGAVTKFTGVYSGKYYKSGKLATASSSYYKVYNDKLYKVKANGSASIYKKDTSKSGTYVKLVDNIYYNVNYKTGAVTKFTGVYSGKYYKSGRLAKASSTYYKVYKDKLYKVKANGSASVYKKNTSKSGTYIKIVDKICYNVSYKTGAVTKFTGVYSGKYYKSGKLTNGWQTVKNKKYYCKSGVPVKGVNKISGKVYYFDSKGVKYTGTGWKTISKKKYYFVKGVAKTGWSLIKREMYHFNSSGVLSKNKKVDGINVNKNGKATGPKKAYVKLYAKLLAKDITSSSKTKSQNLKACFDYVIKTYKSNGNPRIPHYTKEDWIYVYAYDMYGDRGGGNCFSYAAAFAFLAKQCGYKEVYACNSGGHGWVEIDGKVYDPEQYKDVGKKIYALDYSNSKIKNYKGAISSYKKNPWMRVKIPE